MEAVKELRGKKCLLEGGLLGREVENRERKEGPRLAREGEYNQRAHGFSRVCFGGRAAATVGLFFADSKSRVVFCQGG